jgi:hypothetical protein
LAVVRQYAALLIAALAVLAVVATALRRRRPAPAAAKPGAGVPPAGAAFVSTVAESPVGSPVPDVDLDVGDGASPSATPHRGD